MPVARTDMSTAPELFTLDNAAWQVRVAPSLGGAIVDARWHGRAVLRPMPEAELLARNVRKSACYPLVPFSNRIAFGSFTFGGTRYMLDPNLAGMPHAIHGVGFQQAWRTESHDAQAIHMTLTHTPDTHWPFAFDARQSMSLDGDTLVLTLRVRNTDGRSAPCGAGWHPFFPLDTGAGATRLHTEWTAMLVGDANDLPCAVTQPPSFGAIDDTVVDNCFTGWKRQAQIDTPHHRATLEASENLPCAVFFRPAGASFFAFEPVSHANNAINGQSPPMHVLAPGETLDARVTLSIQALAVGASADRFTDTIRR
jgi:aldose 1-epimerase